jgi:hypothetical protein
MSEDAPESLGTQLGREIARLCQCPEPEGPRPLGLEETD